MHPDARLVEGSCHGIPTTKQRHAFTNCGAAQVRVCSMRSHNRTIEMPGPYEGIRVIELGRFIAAPYCGQLLADGGADVIKVEPLAGDDARRNGEQKQDPGAQAGDAVFLLQQSYSRLDAPLPLEVSLGSRLPVGRVAGIVRSACDA